MKIRKWMALALASAMCGGLLAGCSSGSSETETSAGEAQTEAAAGAKRRERLRQKAPATMSFAIT